MATRDPPFLISSLDGGITRVKLSGDVDLPGTPEIQSALDELVAAGHTRLLIDLTDVSFIASSGLGVLLVTHRQLERAGGSLAVLCPAPTMRGLFELVGHTLTFPVEGTLEQALAYLRQGAAEQRSASP